MGGPGRTLGHLIGDDPWLQRTVDGLVAHDD
jgi:hypothetical protein